MKDKVRALLAGIHMSLKPMEHTGTPLVDEVMGPQFFQHIGHATDVMSNTHYGLADCRITLEGSETILGVPIDKISMEGPSKVHSGMLGMQAASFLKLAKESGFVYVSQANDMVAIPPGYALLILNVYKDKACQGIRWQPLLSTQFQEKSTAYLSKVLQEYPALERGAHSALLEFLTSMAA